MIDVLIGIAVFISIATPYVILFSCLKAAGDADDETNREYIEGESNGRK